VQNKVQDINKIHANINGKTTVCVRTVAHGVAEKKRCRVVTNREAHNVFDKRTFY